jgi:hypothetical protein
MINVWSKYGEPRLNGNGKNDLIKKTVPPLLILEKPIYQLLLSRLQRKSFKARHLHFRQWWYSFFD